MFRLTPLAVALQGIGYATLLVSLQGLADVTVAPEYVEPPGSHMAAVPKRRIKRWPRPVDVPAPVVAMKTPVVDDEQDDEETLALVGAI